VTAHGGVLPPGSRRFKPDPVPPCSRCFPAAQRVMIRVLLLLALLPAACSAPGFPKRKPGDPPRVEMTMEASVPL